MATSYPKASDWAQAVMQRLRGIMGKSADSPYVRLVATPNPKQGHYNAQEGIAVNIGAPVPQPTSGAGRYGLKVSRIVEVTVASQNFLDQAGSDSSAMIAHLDLEEAVVDAVLDGYPGVPSPVGITCNWVPGGSDVTRMVRKDQGMLSSTLHFEITYPAKLSVRASGT